MEVKAATIWEVETEMVQHRQKIMEMEMQQMEGHHRFPHHP